MTTPHSPKRLAGLGLAILLSGCAVSKTMNVSRHDTGKISKPTQVLVQDFAVDSGSVKGSTSPLARLQNLTDSNHEGDARNELMRDANDALYDKLASQLKELGFTPVRVKAGQTPKQGEIMITGQFTSIDEGNAVRRAMVGFGAGQSSVDATVQVLASDQREMLSLKAHADSGRAPGAAVTAGVGAAAQTGAAATTATSVVRGGAKAYQSAISTQAGEIAEKVGEEFAKLAKSQGWISGQGNS